MDSFKNTLEYMNTNSNHIDELDYKQIMEWRS